MYILYLQYMYKTATEADMALNTKKSCERNLLNRVLTNTPFSFFQILYGIKVDAFLFTAKRESRAPPPSVWLI